MARLSSGTALLGRRGVDEEANEVLSDVLRGLPLGHTPVTVLLGNGLVESVFAGMTVAASRFTAAVATVWRPHR